MYHVQMVGKRHDLTDLGTYVLHNFLGYIPY
jgi:hypothetical protein